MFNFSSFFNRNREFILKFKFTQIKLGKNVIIDHKTNIIIYENECIISDNVTLRSNPRGYHAGMPFSTTILIDVKGANVFIGENCRLNGVYIHAQSSISIGKNCVIAAGVNIIDSNGHVLASLNRTKGRDTPQSITIGENVWIGLNAIILKGTTIGDNSVISAGSVVKGKFPKNSIIAGNPAEVVENLNFKE